MKDQKFIALDIGNVCISLRNPVFPDASTETSLSNENIVSLCNELEVGRIDEYFFLKEMQKALNNKYSKQEIYKVFCSVLGDEIQGMKDIIEFLVSKKVAITFLSDTSVIHHRESCAKLSFANLVIGGVFSYETGVLKPDPIMFKTFEKRYGKPALYIDDKQCNCDGAEKLGWNVHCFKSIELLKPVVEGLQ